MNLKVVILTLLLILIQSCSVNDDIVKYTSTKSDLTEFESELFILVNKDRRVNGLNNVKTDKLARSLANDHCIYMINDGSISHDNFPVRMSELTRNGAELVGEVVGFGYNNPEGFINGYLNSDGHKRIIENGKYTHVGVKSIKNDEGRYYNVMIFIKISE